MVGYCSTGHRNCTSSRVDYIRNTHTRAHAHAHTHRRTFSRTSITAVKNCSCWLRFDGT
uniref:Uncharacterized protein n=1 Tax=Anguilla anguilla TaxID=7936 RepID=A0A0E9RZ47_ANGAN